MNESDARKMLTALTSVKIVGNRKLTLFSETSYQEEKYRVWFYHLEGSPTIALGFIQRCTQGYRFTLRHGGLTRTRYFNLDFNLSTAIKVAA